MNRRPRALGRTPFEVQSGYPDGRPGYVVDHIKPLACGGADAPSNTQWQTIAEAKVKDPSASRAGRRAPERTRRPPEAGQRMWRTEPSTTAFRVVELVGAEIRKRLEAPVTR
jgi:hypothetical protein